MSNEKITTETITVPEIEKLLVDTRTELLEAAKRDGKHTGLKNVPGATDPSCAPHLAPIKTLTEQRRSAALTNLQPDMQIAAIKRIDEKLTEKQSEINPRIEELGHLNDVDRRELDGKCVPEKCKPNTIGWVLTGFNCISDIAFNSAAFEFLGDSLGMAIGIAFGVAVATFVFAKGIVHCIRRACAGNKLWYVAAGGIALAAGAGFWVLSGFRANEMAANGVANSSQSGYFLLNLFFFTAAVLIALIFFPADSQSPEDKELERRFEKIKQREEEITQLKQQLEELRNTAAQERRNHLLLLSYTVHTVNRFRALYMEGIANWKSSNLLARADRQIPVSFSEPVIELDRLELNLPPSLDLNAT